jgi:hypothetical protein
VQFKPLQGVRIRSVPPSILAALQTLIVITLSTATVGSSFFTFALTAMTCLASVQFSVSRIKLQVADKDKRDTQCTYNVTLRGVRVTIVAVEKQ